MDRTERLSEEQVAALSRQGGLRGGFLEEHPMPVTRGWSEERLLADPPVMAPVVQLFKRDIPGDHGLLPDWMFPAGSDLQILWCPNQHPGTFAPHARLFWRDTRELRKPAPRHPELNQAGLDQAVPVPCRLHPELIAELPPLKSVPAPLRDRLSGWQHPDEPAWEDWTHYDALATAPGWKLGGWAPWAGETTGPEPFSVCSCGAPTRLLLDAMSNEDLDGWWFPAEPPDFTWGQPRDWQYSEPTDVRVGGDGLQALFACTANPSHPLITHTE